MGLGTPRHKVGTRYHRGRKSSQRHARKLRGWAGIRHAVLVNTCRKTESQMEKETEGDSKDTVTKGIFQGWLEELALP